MSEQGENNSFNGSNATLQNCQTVNTACTNPSLCSTPGFAHTTTATDSSGVVKFTPVIGTDTVIKNKVLETISTRCQCITCMEEYKTKSLEEIRLEDYAAGRLIPVRFRLNNDAFGAATTTRIFAFNNTNDTTTNNRQAQPFGSAPTSNPQDLNLPTSTMSPLDLGQTFQDLFGAIPLETSLKPRDSDTTSIFVFGQNANNPVLYSFKHTGQTTEFSSNNKPVASTDLGTTETSLFAAAAFGTNISRQESDVNSQHNTGSIPMYQQVLELLSVSSVNSPLLKNLKKNLSTKLVFQLPLSFVRDYLFYQMQI